MNGWMDALENANFILITIEISLKTTEHKKNRTQL